MSGLGRRRSMRMPPYDASCIMNPPVARSAGNRRTHPPGLGGSFHCLRRVLRGPALNYVLYLVHTKKFLISSILHHGPFLTQATYTLLDVELLNGRTKNDPEKMEVIMLALLSLRGIRASHLLTSPRTTRQYIFINRIALHGKDQSANQYEYVIQT